MSEGGAASQSNQMQKLSMIMLRLATPRHGHTERTVETKILTSYLPCQEGEGRLGLNSATTIQSL